MSEGTSTIIYTLSDHQVECLRGSFHREILARPETKIVNKIGYTSDGRLIVEYIEDDVCKTTDFPKIKP